jgi:hypothetical protein
MGARPGVIIPASPVTGPAPQPWTASPAPQYRPVPAPPVYKPAPTSNSAILITGLVTIVVAVFVAWAIWTHLEKKDERALAADRAKTQAIIGSGLDFGEDGAMAMVPVLPNGPSPGTIITRTFPLNNEAAFSIDNLYGEIVIDGWDEQKAEISVIKYGVKPGGDPPGRIVFSGDEQNFKISTVGNGSKIGYHVKLPRALSNLDITAVTGPVTVSSIRASISADIGAGGISLNDVTGAATVQAKSGDISASFDDTDGGKPLRFVVDRGAISLRFKSPLDAELMARTENGIMSIDSGLGGNVKTKAFVDETTKKTGVEGSGQFGAGRGRLWVRAREGNIIISK